MMATSCNMAVIFQLIGSTRDMVYKVNISYWTSMLWSIDNRIVVETGAGEKF